MRLLPGLLAIGFLALACQPNKQQTSVRFEDGSAIYDPAELNEVLEKSKIPASQRMESLEALHQTFKNSYVGYDFKKLLTGRSGEEIFQACLTRNGQNPEAMTSFAFYDEVLKCLAPFQDTHIGLTRTLSSVWLYTGIGDIIYSNGKVHIATTRTELLKKIEKMQLMEEGELTKIIQVGSEILEVDGKSTADAITELKTYIIASSEGSRNLEAATALFKRNFFYPKSTDLKLRVKTKDGAEHKVNLPWVQFEAYGALDAKNFLKENKFIDLSQENKDDTLKNRDGYTVSLPLFANLSEARNFYSNDDMIMRTAVAEAEQQKSCYLQIYSFNVDKGSDPTKLYTIREKTATGMQTIGFITAAREFLTYCESQKLPLVFDLRDNEGGSPNLAQAIFYLLEKADTPISYMAAALSTAPANIPIMLGYIEDLKSDTTSTITDLYYQGYKAALAVGSKMTSWIVDRPNNFLGIFSGKVVVLTSPQCVSACDNIANRFKMTGRATIAGEPTNGTGFGFNATARANTSFVDPFRLYEVSIPNRTFQAALVTSEPTTLVRDGSQKGFILPFAEVPLLENRPTQPDVEILITAKDLEGSSDYIQKLLPLLK